MGKQSGEQARRVVRGLAASERYAATMLTRDKMRMVQVLRSAANRLEAEAKGEGVKRRATRHEPSALAVTDHALVRFLERAVGLDMDAIRNQIARLVPPGAPAFAGDSIGEHSIICRGGFQFLVTPSSIISVLAPGMEAKGWLERDEIDALEAA